MHSAFTIEKYSQNYNFCTLLQKKNQSVLSALIPKQKLDTNSQLQKKQHYDILQEQQQPQQQNQNTQKSEEGKADQLNGQHEETQLQNSSMVLKETLHSKSEEHTRQCFLLENEYFYLSQIKHPYIIELTSHVERAVASCYFTLEKGICDMYDRTFRENPYSFKGRSMDEIRVCFKQIALALHYLHTELHVAHNDVKPENIIMFEDNLYKLADFEYANKLERREIYSSELFNRWKNRCKEYMAPELLHLVRIHKDIPSTVSNTLKKSQQQYQYYIDESKADIFSLGATLFVMVFSVLPYKTSEGAFQEDEIYQNLDLKKNYKYFWMHFTEIIEALRKEEKETGQQYNLNELQDLLENLLCHNPKERFTALEAALHPWVQNNCIKKENNFSLDSSPSSH